MYTRQSISVGFATMRRVRIAVVFLSLAVAWTFLPAGVCAARGEWVDSDITVLGPISDTARGSYLGVRIGFGVGRVEDKTDVPGLFYLPINDDARKGVNMAAVYVYRVSRVFELQSELALAYKGGRFQSNRVFTFTPPYYDSVYQFTYVSVPVLARLYIGKVSSWSAFAFAAGPELSYLSASKSRVTDSFPWKDTEGLGEVDLSLAIRFELHFGTGKWHGVITNGRSLGLTNIHTGSSDSIYNGFGSLSLTLLYKL